MNRTQQAAGSTRSVKMAALLACLYFAFSPTAALATDVRLVNYAAYAYVSNTANLRTDGVQNFDATSQSDQLRLELWAFSSPYVTGMSGLRLAVFALPSLDPGTQTGPINSGTVLFTRPPDGVWYFAMLLTEFTGTSPGNDGYVARYAIDFPTPEYIGVPPPPNQFDSIEFYHLGFDHYFVAATAQDIIDLDTGVHPGWTRTGYGFNVWDGPGAGVVAVCRYYIPPGSGDSHFFSASAYECGIAPSMFPLIVKESDLAFTIALPDPDTGACASMDIPVYRLWNGRYDSNHRYTTSTTVKALMLAKGYVAEGYGPDQVAMCAPQ